MRVNYGWDIRYPKPEYWDTRTPLYISMPKVFHLYQDLNDKKLRVFFKKVRGRILDAGCGDGRFVGFADVGADFSKSMLRRARNSHRNKYFVRASILYLPFKGKTFSAAFTVDVFLHIQPEKRESALRELKRVAEVSYNFLPENRTIIPFIFEPFRKTHARTLWLTIPYIALFFAFPFDRVRKLRIDSPSQLLTKLMI